MKKQGCTDLGRLVVLVPIFTAASNNCGTIMAVFFLRKNVYQFASTA